MTHTPDAPRLRNTRTQAINRRQSFWQIGLPIGLAGSAAIVLMVLAASPGGFPMRSALADVSLIVLIIPTALIGLVLLAVIIGLCAAAWYALAELPYVFKQAQDFAFLVAHRTKFVAQKVADAVLSVHSTAAAGQELLDKIRSLLTLRRSG